MVKSDYSGKIKNSGNQTVEAVIKKPSKKPGKTVRGADLRAGKGKK